jgi:hypothetical protein
MISDPAGRNLRTEKPWTGLFVIGYPKIGLYRQRYSIIEDENYGYGFWPKLRGTG